MAAPRPATYDQYIKSAKWQNISSAMKKLANFTCERCGKKLHSSELDVHHKHYENFGNEQRSDLEVLCRPCHVIADAARVAKVEVRREERRNESGTHTYLSKKYGDNYAAVANDGMYEEHERWLAKKRFGEFGEDW